MGEYQFRFGTAGIRARAGAGPGELHLGSVRVIAHAIALGLSPRVGPAGTRRICLGFDGRRDSRAFADEIAATLLGHGYEVAYFTEPCPTPLLAFALRRSSASIAGVMVTASHNPPEDNGIKLYLDGGRQLSAPLDQEIEAHIAAYTGASIPRTELAHARSLGQLLALGAAEQSAYVDMLARLVPSLPEAPLPKLAYSALCGVGGGVARALFQTLGAQVAEVREQAEPRADFGGLRSPNPEEPDALVLLRALAEREGSALAFAHDPDADRLALLARAPDGQLRSLSGDEVGALIGDFLLAQTPDPTQALLVSTQVSGGLLERICTARGAHFLRTPTGFKWIAELGRERAARDGRQLLFGYEEALGYAFFAQADDKDGSAAMRVLCELARTLAVRGASLIERLDELAREHGLFAARPLSVRLRGPDGPAQVARIMDRLRALPLDALLGPGAVREDHARAATPSALLVLRDAAAGTRVCVRPSGTEPKLKLYLHVREPVQTSVQAARLAAEARLDQLAQQLGPQLTA